MSDPVNPKSQGFVNHAIFGLKNDISPSINNEHYKKNLLENIGEVCIWHVRRLPIHIKNCFSDPRVATIALTALAMLATQFAFYPIKSFNYAKLIITTLLPYIKPWVIKLTCYILVELAVFGYGTRALGRFTNKDLMTKWHNLQQNVE